MKNYIYILGLVLLSLSASTQTYSYEVELEPITIPNLGGLQSYAFATHNEEWLIIGGRLDGLHQRQPFASFDEQGINQHLIVVNPVTNEVWKKEISALPAPLKEQLGSTNIQFYQDGAHLLLTGGYAFSPTHNDHVTFPYLTIINVENVINQVKNEEIAASDFIQIEEETFRVTGGRLAKINDTFYLVGGHKFMGRYNPMGPNNGPGFIQEYTNEVRKFTIADFDKIDVQILSPIHDEVHLHRRDYNLLPHIYDDEYQLMLYSGVFQKSADVPWLYPVSITPDEHIPYEDFNQYYNHYHCATLPIYNSDQKEMHTIFFGGIAQFYNANDTMVQDNDVPFVTTITDVTRSQNGDFQEIVLTEKMPGYLGAGSEFILSPNIELIEDGIVNGDLIDDQPYEVGYIYGGIKSTMPNIFWINTGVESLASSVIYKVSLKKSTVTSTNSVEDKPHKVLIYPNPAQDYIRMAVNIDKTEDIHINIYNNSGQKVHNQIFKKDTLHVGTNYLILNNTNVGFGAYFYNIKIGDKIINRKVIWTE